MVKQYILQKESALIHLVRYSDLFTISTKAKGSSLPARNFRFGYKFRYKIEFCLLTWTAVNGSYSFKKLSVIVRLCSVVLLSVQFGIVSRNEIVFLLCQKQPKALQYLPIFHQNRQKQNGSKCTNDNPSNSLLEFYWFPKRSTSVEYTTV